VTGISLAIETDAMFVLSTNSAFLPVTQVHTVSLKYVFLSNLFLRADTETLVIYTAVETARRNYTALRQVFLTSRQ